MSERSLWRTVRTCLSDDFFLERIENLVGAGTPDVLYAHRATGATGLVELKSESRRGDRVLRADLSLEQVRWLESWPGASWILVKSRPGPTYALVSGRCAGALRRGVPWGIAGEIAGVVGFGAFPGDKISEVLSKKR